MVDRRRKEYRQVLRSLPAAQTLMSETIDGREYHYRLEPRCKVCTLPDGIRETVDAMLISPMTYSEIVEKIRPTLEEWEIEEKRFPSWQSIRGHQKKHLPFDQLAVREIVERRAKEQQRTILEGKHSLLTAHAFYEVIAQKGWDAVVSGDKDVSVNEAIKAMQSLQELERVEQDEHSIANLMSQLEVILNAVRDVAPPEVLEQISNRIQELQEGSDVNTIDANSIHPENNHSEDGPGEDGPGEDGEDGEGGGEDG